MKVGTIDFFERVYEVVRLIPVGRVTTYGAIAKALGAPGGARMVGYALNAVHKYQIGIPAHRVVNRKGLLTGKMHFSPPERMQVLLEAEGVVIKDDTVVDFKRIFWEPVRI